MRIRFYRYAGGERVTDIMVWAFLAFFAFMIFIFFKLSSYYVDFGSFLKHYLKGNFLNKVLVISMPFIVIGFLILFLQIFRDFYFLISKKKISNAIVRDKKLTSSTPVKTGIPSHTYYYIYFEHNGKIFRQEISYSDYQRINTGDYIRVKYTNRFIHKAKAILH